MDVSHVIYHLPKPAIIAHRGSSKYAPENTLSAFNLSIRQGADGVELDVRLSSDGYLVVIHNDSVEITTDGIGKVSNLPLIALKELDAGSHKGSSFRGEKIPTLDEVFETLGKQLLVNVELKNLNIQLNNLAEKVALTIKRHSLENYALVSSFNPLALDAFKRQLPEVPLGLLLPGGKKYWLPNALIRNLASYQSLHPYFADISPRLINRLHKKGRHVFAYTVNQEEDFRRLKSYKVDGLITDDPLLARDVLQKATP